MAGGAGSNTGTPAASNPLGPQQGQGTPAFGGQQQPMQQQPLGTTPFSSANSTTQQDMMGRGGSGKPFGQVLGQLGFGGLGGQQQPSMPSFATPQQQPSGSGFGVFGGGFGGGQQQPRQNPFQPQQPLSIDDYYKAPQITQSVALRPGEREAEYQQYRDNFGKPSGMQVAQPQTMQNPFQPQQPSFMQDPEYQGYQTQANELNRQMDEYMRKAPMYQQLQDLQNKMAPFQQRHQQQRHQQQQDMQQRQMQQRQFQQPSPFRRGQFQQPAGIQGLMAMLGGRGNSFKNGGKV